jgi:hypothetical protein
VQNCPAALGLIAATSPSSPVSCEATGLQPSTTYSFVLDVCWGSWGPTSTCSWGTMLTFTTAASAGAAVDVAVSPSPVVVGQPFEISYQINRDCSGQPATANVEIVSDPSHSRIWSSSTIHVPCGVRNDVSPPPMSTPGSYMVGVSVVLPSTGPLPGAAVVGTAKFHVVAGGAVFDFTMAVSPGSTSVSQGETAHYRVMLTYSDPSYSGTIVNIQATGLGPGMGWHLTESGDLSITTSSITPPGTYTITLTGFANGVSHPAAATLIVTASQPATTTAQTTTSPTTATSVSFTTVTQTTISPTTVTETVAPPTTWTSAAATTSQATAGQTSQGGGSFIEMIPGGAVTLAAVAAVIILAAAVILLFQRGGARPPTEPTAPPSTTPGAAQPPVQPPSLKYCISCGAQIPRSAKFCPECRANQTQ